MSDRESKPESPPFHPRKLRFNRAQLIGIPLLLIVPVLAMFNIFGPSRREVNVASQALHVRIKYPRCLHFSTSDRIEVEVRNTGPAPLEDLAATLSRDYLAACGNLAVFPDASELDASGLRIRLGRVPPGETRQAWIQVQGDFYGSHAGEIRVTAGDASLATAPISTFIIP